VRSPQGPSIRQNAGGVTSALLPIVETSGGKWVVWHPGSAEDKPDIMRRLPYLSLVDVSADDVRTYYRGFANGALWPLCHYALDRSSFAGEDWNGYVRVNGRFARRLAHEAKPGDLVWVHDYHLCLVPALLRKDLPRARIAYFHHIPFPAPDLFRVLPWYREILTGLLGADQVAFHTQSYVQNFLQTCALLPGAAIDTAASTVEIGGRRTKVAAFPIGIDADGIRRTAETASVKRQAAKVREGLRVHKLLLSVDRLDYTKGIVERFEAIDHFFARNPELKGIVSLLQIAVPSREKAPQYRQLKKDVDELIGRVNGRHAQDGWQPIYCMYRSFPMERLVAFYLAADVALVTPVRDGMNLVAKEFCASRVDDDGVLVLSEFAGAAERLGAGSVLVNPYNLQEFSQAIGRSLTMEREERRRRMSVLRGLVAENDVGKWVDDIVASLSQA
jgi:trehalose 6-phosphate synthase